jgi:hypothetical protein
MTATVNRRALDHVRELIATGRYVIDDRDAWSEHQLHAAGERVHRTARHG